MKEVKSSRLRELRNESGKDYAEFANLFGIAESTQKSYENGNRTIPVEYALKVCNECHVTMDWIYGRSENKNETSAIISSILLALSKVFKFKENCLPDHRAALYIDKTFSDYLIDIENLEKQYDDLGDELFAEAYARMQEKYKSLLHQLFGDINYDGKNDKFVEISKLRTAEIICLLYAGEWDN